MELDRAPDYLSPEDGELASVLRREADLMGEFYDALKSRGLHESAIDSILAAWASVRFRVAEDE